SHKPFPTGRATHGGIDGLQQLIEAHDLTAERIRAGRFIVPPLTHRLVGRPAEPGMAIAAARLSLVYAGAVCLLRGTVAIDDFTSAALNDATTLELAGRLAVVADDNQIGRASCRERVSVAGG